MNEKGTNIEPENTKQTANLSKDTNSLRSIGSHADGHTFSFRDMKNRAMHSLPFARDSYGP